jgi:single-stranded-DNA-specific exonuclease
MSQTLERPVFIERSRDATVERAALAEGYTPLQSRVLAGRLSDVADGQIGRTVQPTSIDLDGPETLPDIAVAATLIADAVVNDRSIAIVTDHDADGATSHAILRLALEQMGASSERISGFLSHRMIEGYGVSDALVDRMLLDLPPSTCIVTADQGSADEARIFRLRQYGHDVVVTDHHGIPIEGPPKSANAVVNPVRTDSQFPDKAIAGCHTALLVMAAVREELIRRGQDASHLPRVSELMDFCAVGTIADASSLGQSRNNRLIVQRGLRIMNTRPRPCWNALRRLVGKSGDWVSADIAFQVATRINARGRLTDAMLGVEFLCATDDEEAFRLVEQLDESNRERRTIEKALTVAATAVARQAVGAGRSGLCLWLGEGSHPGVHGITASRMVEKFGRPTICLSPMHGHPTIATGSIRTTSTFHVLDALDSIRSTHPDLLISAGGHRGAGGLKVLRRNIDALAEAWDRCVAGCYGDTPPGPVLLVDGELEAPSLEHVRELSRLEPFGRSFEPAVFWATWQVNQVRAIGDGSHLKLLLTANGRSTDGVWFNAMEPGGDPPLRAGQSARLAFSVDENIYRGMSRLQLVIRGVDTAKDCE